MTRRTIQRAVAPIILAAAAMLVSPAQAALPRLSCGVYDIAHRYGGTGRLGFCVAFENNLISAGMKNVSGSRHYFVGTAQVELVYYAFDQFPNGGNWVLEKSVPYGMLYLDEVLQTPWRSGFWNAGVYCARIYEPEVHRWRDLHCVDTNGHVHR